MQIKPQPSLSNIVKHYLLIESEEHTHAYYRLFSDGNPGIVFHLSNPLSQWNLNDPVSRRQPKSFVYGQLSHYNNITLNGDLRMLVVVLQPHALFTLFGLPTFELNDNIAELPDLFGSKARDIEAQILSAADLNSTITIIEILLMEKMETAHKSDTCLAWALNLVYQHKGIITVENLLKTLPVTERQLERKFKEYIGTTPKRFCDIIKFQNFIKCLQKHPAGSSISELIYVCGYYDQAHLNNYFNQNTGITPLQYKANHHLLAINFMPVN